MATKSTIPKHACLPPEKLRWRCDPASIPFETTAEIEPVSGDMGQERALRALRMGVELTASGYNLFVCGLSGTSRGGMIVRMIEEMHPQTEPAPDRCYVNNFKNADRPRLLTLPRGQANAFKKEVESGIDFLRRRIPQVFEGEPFQRQKTRIVERFTVREKELMDDFTRRIAREQFALGRMQVGAVALPEIFPVLEGQMVPIEEIPKMVQDGKLENAAAEELERKYDQFRQEFTVVYRKTLSLSRELASEMSYLEQEAASVLVDGVIEELKEKYPSAQIAEYLEEVRHHVLDNLDPFKEREGEEEQPPAGRRPAARAPERADRDPFRVYGVNVILAHGEQEKCPVIFETIPTYANLFGTVHRSYDARGGWNSDFMDLRGGSLLRADGGFLVMYALDALTETGVWRTLKRTLNHGKLEIQPVDMFFPFSTRGAEARADRRAREDNFDRRPRHVRAALRLRGRFQEDFQGARRIRRGNEVERRGVAPIRRPLAQALRRRKASALRPHRRRRHSRARRAHRRTPRKDHHAIFRSRRSGARSPPTPRGTTAATWSPARTCARRWTRKSSATTCSKRKSAK